MSDTNPLSLVLPVMTRFHPEFLAVDAEPRYWEDGTVNGEEDYHGTLMPLREGDAWKAVIRLADGFVLNWPAGTRAEMNYKVCDAGVYHLLDKDSKPICKYKSDYVPSLLGGGDYIELVIRPDGFIDGWKRPELDPERWVLVA